METEPIKIFNETEHQELFHRDAPLHRPIPVQIPSALAALGYYVCLRLPDERLSDFDGVVVKMKVGGLRPVDLTLRAGEGFTGPDRFASKTPGYHWRLICRAFASRGDGELSFEHAPASVASADLLLCTWPRFIEHGYADDWLSCQADPHWAPGGVPLGGIGTGKVELCRDGRFRNFSANNNQDMPFEDPDGLPHAYFAVSNGAKEVLLATRAMDTIAPCPQLRASLLFPRVTLSAPDALPGLDVDVLCAGPLVPHDLERSSLPGLIVRATLRNKTAAPLSATFRFAWPNLAGRGGGIGEAESRTGYGDGFYREWAAPERQSADPIYGRGFAELSYANAPSTIAPNANGRHYLAVRRREGAAELIDRNATRGSVGQTLTIPANGSASVDLALSWEMPRYVDLLGVERGHYWQRAFANGAVVLEKLFADFDTILSGSGALSELFGRTDLPGWLQSRLANCNYPLVTNSVLYRDGRFSINEGPTEMAACFGTIDQRLGAHPATQLFFPELNARELDQFGRIQGPEGGIQHDLGGGHLEREPGEQHWPDLTCSYVLQTARHSWSAGDDAFEAVAWPRARKALLRHGQWADAGNGVAQVGHGLGTSYDGYHYVGTTPYMATLWLAALKVGRRWAQKHGDAELLPKIDAWEKAAHARMEADLWNGRYYQAYNSPKGPTNPNCHAGMLAGEYFARLLCGEDVLPPERLKSCVAALNALNFHEKFAVPPDEATPAGDMGTIFGWLPYVEAFGLTALALVDPEHVMPLWKRMLRHVERDGASVADTRLMYRPDSGAPSWGAYYMTAPASWLVYDALLDFRYEPGDGTLRLVPKITGRFALIHPLFWGIGENTGGRISLSIERRFDSRELSVQRLEVPKDVAALRVGGVETKSSVEAGVYRRFEISPTSLGEGAKMTYEFLK